MRAVKFAKDAYLEIEPARLLRHVEVVAIVVPHRLVPSPIGTLIADSLIMVVQRLR